MRNPIKLLTSAGALILLTVSLNANAQQLPNFGFENWETAGLSATYGSGMYKVDEQRPGNEPVDWNGSSAHKIMTFDVVSMGTENGNNYVCLTNKFNTVLVKTSIPGYLTLGTPWIYGNSDINKCNGGTFGGITFNYKPVALRLKAKRSDNVADELSYVIAYLWNGTFTSNVGENGNPTSGTQNDVDRAVLGTADASAQVSGNGKLVATLQQTINNTVSEWTELKIPFEYDEIAGEPSKLNIIISGGDYWTRTNLKEGTTLWVDDVELVYPTKDYAGKCVTVDLAADESAIATAANSDWADTKMTVEDYGNVVSTDDTGHKTTTGKVTLGDVTLDGVKLTHYDDYLWLEHNDDNYTMDGSLHNNGNYLVYLDQPSANQRIKFADTQSATTGIESVDGVESEPAVFGGQGYVSVAGVHGMVSLYTLTGAKVAEVYVEGEAVIPATAGIVIVATPAGAVKCNVK